VISRQLALARCVKAGYTRSAKEYRIALLICDAENGTSEAEAGHICRVFGRNNRTMKFS
jgi:hypothetical protein